MTNVVWQDGVFRIVATQHFINENLVVQNGEWNSARFTFERNYRDAMGKDAWGEIHPGSDSFTTLWEAFMTEWFKGHKLFKKPNDPKENP